MKTCFTRVLVAVCALFPVSFVRGDEPLDQKPITVPFELLKTQHMVIEVKINGKGPYRLIFDTGAPVNLLNNKVAKEAEVLPKDFKRPAFALFGSVGQFKMKELQLGDLKATDLDTMVMDHPTVALISKYFGPIEGIVGFPLFGKYRMTLDYQKKTMTFVPTKYQPKDMIASLMTMLSSGQAKGPNVVASAAIVGIKVAKDAGDDEAGVTIKQVTPGSAAAKAGLKEGDRLLTLDHRWTDTVADCYAAVSRLQPGTTAPVVIRRDGKEMEMTIEVRRGL